MPRKSVPIGEEFLELQHRLAEWRKDHSRRTPLPEGVWKVAVELARRHGVYRTARSLPIDYGCKFFQCGLHATRFSVDTRLQHLQKAQPSCSTESGQR